MIRSALKKYFKFTVKKKDYKLVLLGGLHSTIPQIQQTREAVGHKGKHKKTPKLLLILQILVMLDVVAMCKDGKLKTNNNLAIPAVFIWQSIKRIK